MYAPSIHKFYQKYIPNLAKHMPSSSSSYFLQSTFLHHFLLKHGCTLMENLCNINKPKQYCHYKCIFVKFMSFVDGITYRENQDFTTEQLGQLTLLEVYHYLCLHAYGKPDPGPEDLPTAAHSSMPKYAKKQSHITSFITVHDKLQNQKFFIACYVLAFIIGFLYHAPCTISSRRPSCAEGFPETNSGSIVPTKLSISS